MTPNNVNLLHPNDLDSPRRAVRRRRGLFSITLVIIALLGTYVFANVILPSITLSRTFASAGLIDQIKHLTLSGDRDIAGHENDRINVAILGIGGEGHAGGLLADTIMIASYEPSSGRAALLSIPRDLYVPYPDGSWRKINAAYAYGVYETDEKKGAETMTQILGSLFGTNIPYYVVADFSGFEEIIDAVGGVDVYVDRAFSDSSYPLDETRTQFISFAQGWQQMDGATALKYARSRMGTNGEGSDFARAKRQQKILLAIKEQVLKGETLLNPITMNRLTATVADNITTNIASWEALRFYQMAADVNSEQIVRVTLTDAPGGLLTSGTSAEGAYILQPRNGDYNGLKTVTEQLFNNGELVQEPARVEVQNGTKIAGLATTKANELANLGYTITYIGNASELNASNTLIYDLTGGARPTALAALRLHLDATIANTIPSWMAESITDYDITTSDQPTNHSQADFLVVLGNDFVANNDNSTQE